MYNLTVSYTASGGRYKAALDKLTEHRRQTKRDIRFALAVAATDWRNGYLTPSEGTHGYSVPRWRDAANPRRDSYELHRDGYPVALISYREAT